MLLSESLKKKVARLLVYVMLTTDVAPAMAMSAMPEYDVHIEKRILTHPETGIEQTGFMITAQKLVTETISGVIRQTYQTIFDQVVAPFMVAATVLQSTVVPALFEILQKASIELKRKKDDSVEETKTTETQISHGFCFSIPEIGNLLISHDGDVVLETEKSLQKSLKISAPFQVILNNATAKDIEVEATSAMLTGRNEADINSLKFKGISGARGKVENVLFVDKDSKLSVSKLDMENSLLLNTGNLQVREAMNLNGGYFLNAGHFGTAADPSVIKNVAHMLNTQTGIIDATAQMLVEADKFENFGKVRAKKLNLQTSSEFKNAGDIETEEKFELESLGKSENSGRINGNAGEVTVAGPKFEHISGQIQGAKLNFESDETEIYGNVVGQDATFRGKTAINGDVVLKHATVEGSLKNNSEVTTFEKRLDLVGQKSEILNNAKITTEKIVSTSENAKITGGEVTATEIHSQKQLILDTNLSGLKTVQTDTEAQLGITERSLTPQLEKIKNFGKTDIHSSTPDLSEIQNEQNGQLFLKSSAALTKIQNLDNLRGQVNLQASLPNVNSLNLQNNATLTLAEGSSLCNLTQLQVGTEASFLAAPNVNFQNLVNLQNSGKTRIESALPELSTLKNEQNGKLFLKSSAALTKIQNLDGLKGQVNLQASLPNVRHLNLPENAQFVALAGTKFKNLKNLKINSGATFVAERRTALPALKNVKNFGNTTFKTALNLNSVYNAPNAELHFLERAKIKGRAKYSWEDLLQKNRYTYISPLTKKEIGLYNEGKILVDVPLRPGEVPDHRADDYHGIDITQGSYVASKNASIIYKKGGVRAKNFANDGISYSPKKLVIHSSGKNTKLGRCVANEGIEYNINSVTGEVEDSLIPLLRGENKDLTIKSAKEVKISKSLNWDVNLDVEAPKFEEESGVNLVVRKLKTRTDIFKNSGRIWTKNGIDIDTQDFSNISGRLETRGNTKIQASRKFLNTGGGKIEKNQEIKLGYYKANGSNAPVWSHATFHRDVYKPELSRAGVITGAGTTEIITGLFDNSFGIVNAAKGLNIDSQSEVVNECGLIYSGGPAFINGTLLKNGYKSSGYNITGKDPNAPIQENQLVKYQEWVESYEIHKHGIAHHRRHKVDTSHFEDRYRYELRTTGYEDKTYYAPSTAYPGYIFSEGDLNINTIRDLYFGTIVSGGDVTIRGRNQRSINYWDGGKIIVRGDLRAELQKAALFQLMIQAQNVAIDLIQDLRLNGISVPVMNSDGSVVELVDLRRIAHHLGFLTDAQITGEQSPTGLVPLRSTEGQANGGFRFRMTTSAGFIGQRPTPQFFLPSVQESVLNQLITLVLTPIYGRDILMSNDLSNTLIKRGSGSSFNNFNLALSDGNPLILFKKSNDPDVEIDVNNERTLAPIYDPILLTTRLCQIVQKIQAANMLRLKDWGNLNIGPGKVNLFDAKTLILEAEKVLGIKGEYIHDPVTGGATGVTKAEISSGAENLVLSGKEGIETQGVSIKNIPNLALKSDNGTIEDKAMPLDPVYERHNHNRLFGPRKGDNISATQQTVTSSMSALDSLSISAPKTNLEGTDLSAGVGGIILDGDEFVWRPAYEKTDFYHKTRRSSAEIHRTIPKVGGMSTPGAITFTTKDTSLIGAKLVSSSVLDLADGTFRTLPAYATQESKSEIRRKHLLGSSSRTTEEKQERVVPTEIFTDHFKSLGTGTYRMQSTVLRALDAEITKNLREETAYDKTYSRVTTRRSGFFAPRIKGDPMVEALRGISNSKVIGEIIPSTFNTVGTTAQTATHLQKLLNLSSNPNPFATVSTILASRYVGGFGYSNVRTTTEREESAPVQTRVELGDETTQGVEVLRISNDRTHLEGCWNARGRAVIETGELTTSAPEHTVAQCSETHGYSVSLSPAAVLGTTMNVAPAFGCLPSVAVQSGASSSSSRVHVPMTFEADDLFIRCDDAVFQGAQIRARLLEAIVTNDLSIETLANEFRSDSHSSAIGASLSAIYGLVHGSESDAGLRDPGLGAVPTMRFANEREMTRKIDELAELVGTERFYLTVGNLLHKKSALVGLAPDGVVTHSENERIEAGRVLEEKVAEAHSHKRCVFNPSIGEFFAMMDQVDEFKRLQSQILREQKINQAFQNMGKSRPVDPQASIRDQAIVHLLEAGARPEEIGEVLKNEQIDAILQDAQKIRYGRGISIVFPGDTEEVIQAKEHERDNNYLQKSLQLCTDAALAVDKFAEENPNLTKYSLLAMDVALSGPSRFAMNFCSREIGLDEKIEDYKEQFKGWLSWKVAETAGISPETSEVLVSGGMFGMSFGLAMGGIQSKEQAIVGEAKNVKSAVEKAERKIGQAGKYEDLTYKIRPKGGFNDGMQAHHMPSQRYLKAHEMNKDDGFSAIMTAEQHKQTRTFGIKGAKEDTSALYRSEIGRDLKEYINILKTDGSWTPEVRKSLMQGLGDFRKEFPELFKKVMK